MIDEKLKPCPFCGSEAKLYEIIPGCGSIIDFNIECLNEDCAAFSIMDEDKEKVIKSWNKRIDENEGND